MNESKSVSFPCMYICRICICMPYIYVVYMRNPSLSINVAAEYVEHYNDVIMSAMASQSTSLTIVYSTVYSRCRSKKTSKLRVTGLCEGNSPVTGEFPAQRASNAENISIRWRHQMTVLGHHSANWKVIYDVHQLSLAFNDSVTHLPTTDVIHMTDEILQNPAVFRVWFFIPDSDVRKHTGENTGVGNSSTRSDSWSSCGIWGAIWERCHVCCERNWWLGKRRRLVWNWQVMCWIFRF